MFARIFFARSARERAGRSARLTRPPSRSAQRSLDQVLATNDEKQRRTKVNIVCCCYHLQSLLRRVCESAAADDDHGVLRTTLLIRTRVVHSQILPPASTDCVHDGPGLLVYVSAHAPGLARTAGQPFLSNLRLLTRLLLPLLPTPAARSLFRCVICRYLQSIVTCAFHQLHARLAVLLASHLL